jgi:hypothetical protein
LSTSLKPAVSHYLQQVSARVEQSIQTLGLVPVAVEDTFAIVSGEIAEMPVTMESYRYTGEAFETYTVAYLRNAAQELLSVTVSGIPYPDKGLPILGLDYVGFRGALSLVALDLCPVQASYWERHCKAFLAILHGQGQQLVQRKVPGFTEGVFSKSAIFAAATNQQQCQESALLADRLLNHVEALCINAERAALVPDAMESNRQHIQRWKRAMQTNKKEHSALSRIFGASFTEKYLKTFLFALEV